MIYLNNAASSHPKPSVVIEAVEEELKHPPANPYRDHADIPSADHRCRTILARLFDAPYPERIILCSGATEAVNLAINGVLPDREIHVVATPFEHNAVLRPLYRFTKIGQINLEIVPLNPYGREAHQDLIKALRPDTGLVVVNHVSNVNGVVLDIRAIHEACRHLNIPVLVDASQSSGTMPINSEDMPWAMIAFTGHKGLLGPAGTGGLVVGTALELEPWKLGGSGIHSEYESMPDIWPLKYEAGTLNHPGLAGLAASVSYILDQGLEYFARIKNELAQDLQERLSRLPDVSLSLPSNAENPCGIVSFTLNGWTPREVGYIPQESFDIRVRTGLHCAPLIHKFLGVYPNGTIRVSFSTENTHEDVSQLVQALSAILNHP